LQAGQESGDRLSAGRKKRLKLRIRLPVRRLWDELRRRHVVRVVIYYAVFAWVVIQVGDVLLDAFGLDHLLRFLVAGVMAALPLVLALSWMFDITPTGVERTAPLASAAPEPFEAPSGSLAVLPFANLSRDPDNEYFSDGLAEEIRNQLACAPGLKVAARSSSVVFKGRTEDAREIGRRLNVAAILEGGVRKQADAVRISLQLVNTSDGYQVWSENYERRLEDIFRLQRDVAAAVTDIVAPLSGSAPAAVPGAAPHGFEAYNLYLRGRHYFHKRTETSLRRAVEYFEQAIGLDSDYALAHSGLSDAWILLSSRYYGNLPAEATVSKALPSARRAIDLAPALAEAHASLGLVWENKGDLEAAGQSLRQALQLNPRYTMALVWYGLVLVKQGHFREAAQRNLEALQLDPLSPIINVNVGFDALRRGDTGRAKSSFAAAVEIDPDFPVSHYGLARAHALVREFDTALREIGEAIRCAPGRAFYHAQRSLILLQTGDIETAARSVEEACDLSPDNPFDADLVVAHYMARGDPEALARIANGETGRRYNACQRAQALVALDNHEDARRLYETTTLNREQELMDLITDDWVWRLPHVINLAHLRMKAGDPRGAEELEQLLVDLDSIAQQGVSNPLARYWAASASLLLGRSSEARNLLSEARAVGWNHEWWEHLDWNLDGPSDH
jgi:TolB-like protein/Tfp pilus assembly protein PilF